jgi:tRNA dimethylallyltransferase
MAKEALEEIYANGQIPIVAGGTGFYIQALLYDVAFTTQESDEAFRQEMERCAAEHGAHALHEKLKAVDPVSYDAIHENNVKRTIRALEYHHLTGQPISAHNEEEHRRTSPYNFAYFVLTDERAHLYERIDRRVDLMMERGLLAEVERLRKMGCHRDMVSMQGLGYKELLDYLEGICTLEEAVYVIKRESRHFAKRQLTWFRRERDVIWLEKQKYNYEDGAILKEMRAILQEKGILA